MNISIYKDEADLGFTGKNAAGNTVKFDTVPDHGGVSPMESLLMAACTCAAMDFVSIMKKMKQEFTDFRIDASAERRDTGTCKPFSKIDVHLFIQGSADAEKSFHALSLSIDKYCSVMESLDPACEVHYHLHLNDTLQKSGRKPVSE